MPRSSGPLTPPPARIGNRRPTRSRCAGAWSGRARASRAVAERPAPHLGEQLLPGERLARVPHQEDEQVILTRGQLDQLALGPDLVRGKIYHQVAIGDGAEVELV